MENLKEYVTPKSNIVYFSGVKYWIPKKCPHCSNAISVDMRKMETFPYTQNKNVDILLHNCPNCFKYFIACHLRNKKENTNEFISSYPNFVEHQHPEIVTKFSPRFVDIFKQAHIAEQMNHLELAGTGYRMALEILVKDFLISEYPHEKDKVEKMTLYECIKNYFNELESAAPSHVVRILGNDYAHYTQKYNEVQFNEIKYYLKFLFLTLT